MRTLFHLIRRKNPQGTIVLSQIIHRPIDSVLTEQDRLKVNKGYQKFAKDLKQGCYSWKTWRVIECNDKSVDISLFCKDKLHLNFRGNHKLKTFIESNIITIKGIISKSKNRKT